MATVETMAKLDGLETVLDFLKGLQPKIAAQIAKKVMSLNVDPLPADYKELTGYAGYYRVDSGEYRIWLGADVQDCPYWQGEIKGATNS
jgi:mRNA interferase RelE/StbE